MSIDTAAAPSGFADLVAQARGSMTKAVAEPLWQSGSAAVADGMRELAALRAQVDGALLALTSEAVGRGLYLDLALRPGGWVRALTRFSPQDCRRLSDLAQAARRYPLAGDALRQGQASATQGTAIVEAIDGLVGLPAADDAVLVQAEELLIAQAAVLDPVGLRQVGLELRRTLAARAPDVDDPTEAAAVEAAADREAAAAAARRHLDVDVARDGMWHVRGLLDPLAGAALVAALEPLSAPEPTVVEPSGRVLRDERTTGQRRHDGLVRLLDHALDAGTLGGAGGERPHVTVTMHHAELLALRAAHLQPLPDGDPALPGAPWREGYDRARLDAGGVLAPADLRALLCDARLLPVVLGGPGQVLDVGRASRLFSPAQRRALAVRDRGCVWPGCPAPVARTHAHHLVHWVDGGASDLANGALLCPTHHRRLHRQGWDARLAANGFPELAPPVLLDPLQRPVQHHRWHLDLRRPAADAPSGADPPAGDGP